ncbi:MAG: sulfatase-like hydrolase/transferase [Deltaproteobacteria bacterium]|nr:sulfatase-like hydrolase/transferase [Deltaproteobacteria bacterium]
MIFLLACTGADGDAALDSREAGGGGRTLILLTLDTVRADHVTGEHMPWLSALAAGGLVVPDLATHTWTYPGIGAVLSGRHPSAWGEASWEDQRDEEYPFALSPEVPLLAEILGERGWATAYWSANRIAADGTGLERGYDSFTLFDEGATPAAAAEIVAWWEENRALDRLVHLHVNDAHSPYDLHADSCAAEVSAVNDGTCHWDFVDNNEDSLFANLDGREGSFTPESEDYAACVALIQAAYACEVRRQDDDLATTWATLEAAGVTTTALVAVVIDHGEALLDPYTNHGFDPRLPVTAGWAAFAGPGLSPEQLPVPATQEDVVPTLEALLGEDWGQDWTGADVRTLGSDRVRTTFYIGEPPGQPRGQVHSARDTRYHYIRGTTGQCELYDLVADPGELTNLCDGTEPSKQLLDAVDAQEAAVEGFGG